MGPKKGYLGCFNLLSLIFNSADCFRGPLSQDRRGAQGEVGKPRRGYTAELQSKGPTFGKTNWIDGCQVIENSFHVLDLIDAASLMQSGVVGANDCNPGSLQSSESVEWLIRLPKSSYRAV